MPRSHAQFCALLGVELTSRRKGQSYFHVELPNGDEVQISDALKEQIELVLDRELSKARADMEGVRIEPLHKGAA